MKTEKEKKPKIKQSETVIIKRSKVNFAAYNPRKKDKNVIEKLKKNFKKVGFMGGVAWNPVTGNLIGGHKRVETLDLIYGYDGTPETDYDIKVESIELDEKTEKEQNIFLNNKRAQGETDFILMAEMIKDIDIEAAAIEEYDINLIESIVPDFKFGDKNKIQNDIESLNQEEKKAHVKAMKKKIKNSIASSQQTTHITITFETYDEKAQFLEGIGISGDEIFLTSRRFLQSLQN